jgi:hypothetical protein
MNNELKKNQTNDLKQLCILLLSLMERNPKLLNHVDTILNEKKTVSIYLSFTF